MEKTELLDAVDMEILRALQKNARLTTKELAAMVNLSTTPVFERVKRLEQRGYVSKAMWPCSMQRSSAVVSLCFAV